MYLKRVEISGFKSFAEPVTIEFMEGVTCIIGPNGSGKSNISDAMRWVLGEQSAKTLRGGKMEEIIFAGTELRKPKGMAEVSIVLDNSAGILPIDYSEVVLRRRLFRSGESEYFINNNQCRLRDIRELIMDTGIGVDGYSFIGQGKVEKVVSDRPETRREIFEEAAGVIKYKGRKAEAQRRLDGAQINLDRMNDIILDIESRIGGLKTESEKAREYAGLISKYKNLEINITLKNIDSFTEKSKQLKEQLEETGRRMAELRSSRIIAEESLAALRKRDSELEIAATDHRRDIAELNERSLRMSSDAMMSEEKKRQAERDKDRLTQECAQLSERIERETANSSALRDSLDNVEGELDAIKAELEDKLAHAAGVSAESAGLRSMIEQRRGEIFDISRSKSVKEAELAGNLELMANFDDAKLCLDNERAADESEIATIGAARVELDKQLESCESQIAQLAAIRDGAREEYEQLTRQSSELRQSLEKLRIESEQMKTRKKTIEEMEANYEGYSAGIKNLMGRNMPGIRGVVAELMTVDKGYETAIEAALGQTIQNVICDDDEAAKNAISWLKENKAGRLTFLPTGSIKPRDKKPDSAIEAGAGFDAYAINRISFDDRYESVFNYLLGSVIIAGDLDSAVTLSKNNPEGYRFVSLGGEIVSPAGALTGGAYRNKTANLLERRAEIQELALNIDRLIEETANSESMLDELAAGSTECLRRLQDSDQELRASDSEQARLQGEVKALDFRLRELRERLGRNSRDLENCVSDRNKAVAMNERLREEIDAAASRINTLESEAEGEDTDIEAARVASEAANEEVTKIRLRESEARSGRQAISEKLELSGAALASLIIERDSREAELSELRMITEITSGDKDVSGEMSQIEDDKARLAGELEGILAERERIRSEIEKEEYNLTVHSMDLEREISSGTAIEVEIGRQETRVANWKEKLFDEFELSYVQALDYRSEGFVMSSAVKENREIKDRLREIGEVNPGAVKEYDETKERYDFLTEQRDDVLSSMEDYQKIVADMDKISRERFKETFDAVVTNFDESFKQLFGGGTGELRLEDEKDPLESGIVISVRPPGKTKLINIDSYSGGEKSMIAIALMFAILKAKPTPFCILDEIDAALDESNIQRFANYVTGFGDTQFALVTHQRSTMEHADALYGVTMQEQGITSIISLVLGERETEEFAETLDN